MSDQYQDQVYLEKEAEDPNRRSAVADQSTETDGALSLDQTESFSAYLDSQGDALAAPDSFSEWLRQNGDAI
jgi:hypothetical protein